MSGEAAAREAAAREALGAAAVAAEWAGEADQRKGWYGCKETAKQG